MRNARISREEGRPELAIDVDRPKAALLGLSVTNVADSIRTSVAGTQAAFFRQHGNEYPIIVRLREEDRERVEDINDVLINAPSGQVMQAKNLLTGCATSQVRPRSSARTRSASCACLRSRKSR